MSRCAHLSWLIVTCLLLGAPGGARADDRPAGAVVTFGDLSSRRALAAARHAGGAHYRAMPITDFRPTTARPPTEAVAALRRLYVDADFLGCLTRMQADDLRVDSLLQRGFRHAASEVSVFGAACAFAAGDEGLAKQVLRRAVASDLPMRSLAEAKPEVQQLAEQIQHELLAAHHVALSLRSSPSGARVRVDGDDASCPSTPCRIDVRPGHHVFVFDRIGSLDRTLAVDVTKDGARTVALDPAPAATLRAQVAGRIAAHTAHDDPDLARALAGGAEARVVVLVWRQGPRGVAAAVYDRGLHRFVARSRASGQSALETAVGSVVEEWRGIVEPTPLLARPLFWVAVAGAVAATAATVYFATRPPKRNYVLAFP